MKKHIFLTTLAVILAAISTSCLKDRGNYDYKTLVPIQISNLDTVIAQERLTQLVLNPTVTQNGSDANLTFEWRLRDNRNVPDPLTGVFINKVIGTSKNLSFLLDLPARRYHLILYVTDKTTGVIVAHQIDLVVQSIVPQGLLVFSGNATSGDVSIVVNPLLNAVIPGFTDDFVRHNVFSVNNGGMRTAGAPARIIHIPGADLNYIATFVEGPTGGYLLSAGDMTIQGDYSRFFWEAPATANFQAINTWQTNLVLMNNGNMHRCNQSDPVLFIPFGPPGFGQNFTPAPFIGTNGGIPGVFYDMASKRFMYMTAGAEIVLFQNTQGAGFNPNNVGKEMVYAELGPFNRWYCVMQDEGDPTTRRIYVMDLPAGIWGPANNIGREIIDISTNPGMNNASFFAFGGGARGNAWYYVTGTEVYASALNTPSNLIYDLSANYAGYEVTLLRVFKHPTGNPVNVLNPITPGDSRLLFVGIYNSATSSGILLQFEVNEHDGSLTNPNPTVYTGFERIIDVAYKRI